MPEEKRLDYPEFWDQMKEATQQVDRWPDWEKGSPTNQRDGTQTVQTQPAQSPERERSR